MSTSSRSSILGVNILGLKGSLFSSATNIEHSKSKASLNDTQATRSQAAHPSPKNGPSQSRSMHNRSSTALTTPLAPSKADDISSDALPNILPAKSSSEPSLLIVPNNEPPLRNVEPAAVRRSSIRRDSFKLKPRMTVSTFSTTLIKPPEAAKANSFSSKGSNLPDGQVSSKGRVSPSTSRSASPSSRDDSSSRDDHSTPASSISTAADSSNASEASTGDSSSTKARRRDSFSSPKKMRRPLSMMFSRSAVGEPVAPSVGRSSLANSITASEIDAQPANTLTKRVKDELTDAFKILESEYNKYQSRAGVQKANVVRLALVAFLRKYSNKSSAGIPYEELDRRVRILHRWWTGLLAQLKNRSSNAVSGVDRPVYLEGIAGIMARPEWRPPQSDFAPTCQQIMIQPQSKSTSSSSLASMASDSSLRKSVHHNIKTLFTRTLMETLAFAVEKMGLPTAAGTMVAFSGKVLAYAFYFCTGVAEALIGLWDLDPSVVRRVVRTYETENPANLRKIAELILESFPEHLHCLGYAGLATTLRRMKRPKQLPTGTNVDWRGPWVPRWCGKDTDLLFVFFKHYHLLLADYIPPDASNNARLCAPGFAMVMAQTLTVLDATIHRQTAESPFPPVLEPNRGAISQLTFDEMLANATVTVPVPNRNSNRPMADNKIVVLLRDLVMQKSPMPEACREEHISAICLMIQSATKNTSIFDADSCFALCDLIDEILPLLQRAEQNSLRGTQFVDWDFWIDVWRRMLLSDNNMTELRVICLLYGMWGKLSDEKEKKRNICINWLLTESVWDRFFTHWCPMVRAYYMRLICWRCVRFDGEADEVDIEIYRLVLFRLRTTNNAHLLLKEQAEQNKVTPPSSMPCHPAPGRRLIILRTDTQNGGPGNGVLTFDDAVQPTFLPTLGSNQPIRSRSSSSVSALSDDEASDLKGSGRKDPAPSVKKRWSFMRGWGFSASDSPSSSSDTSPSAAQKSEPKSTPPVTRGTPVFKFSLEWLNQPPFAVRGGSLGPARLPRAAHAYLEGELEIHDVVPALPYEVPAKACWKYAGRAIAEWIFIVVESENFFERRKSEGKATNADVETPILGVDTLKKL